MGNVAAALQMSPGQRETLISIERSHTAEHRQVQRARALLLAADGVANARIARDVGVSRPTVKEWRGRFEAEGLAHFGEVRSGRGRRPSIPEAKIAQIVDWTLHSKPE